MPQILAITREMYCPAFNLDQAATGESLSTQRKDIKGFVGYHGWRLTKTWFFEKQKTKPVLVYMGMHMIRGRGFCLSLEGLSSLSSPSSSTIPGSLLFIKGSL